MALQEREDRARDEESEHDPIENAGAFDALEPNRARLRKSIEGMDDVSVGGFRVHFAAERVASKVVELSLIDSQGKVRE